MDFSQLPNTFIVGAAKAGTTSLFNILNRHSQVFGSPVKEIGFFNKDECFEKGMDWYQKNFFEGTSNYLIRMEATPAYLIWSEKTAERIRNIYASEQPVKFIAIFRDPVERAYSHYWHHVRLGIETMPFKDAMLLEDERLRQNWDELCRTGNGKYGYFRAGAYASRLKPFLQNFERERFFFMLQEDLAPDKFPKKLTELLRFLEIDETESMSTQKANIAARSRKKWVADFYWGAKRTALKPLYRKWIPRQVRMEIHNFLFPPTKYPPMGDEMREQLRARYYDEIKELERIINRDLSHWLEAH